MIVKTAGMQGSSVKSALLLQGTQYKQPELFDLEDRYSHFCKKEAGDPFANERNLKTGIPLQKKEKKLTKVNKILGHIIDYANNKTKHSELDAC